MTAKLSPDSIGLIFSMFDGGAETVAIAEAVGCAPSTVVRYLNAAGIVIGRTGGRPKEITADYLSLALSMRESGATWPDVSKKIGFHQSTFQRELRTMRAQSCS